MHAVGLVAGDLVYDVEAVAAAAAEEEEGPDERGWM